MTKRLYVAVTQLRKAVEDEGAHPEYHRAIMAQVKRDWPTLWDAVRAILAADKSRG